ncbi:serpin B4-like [Adelges cooleyi]|uniref:serpin B4-like n=1 Tax=Adelges cooleyi TaxID=133065 RepID=UPI00218084D5|nr:serpin B4-like [Adelges cooleyi]
MALASTAELGIHSLNSAINDFSSSLYTEFRKNDGNIFYSPLSIQLVLFLTSIGAKGKTYEEITNTIRLPPRKSELLPLYKDLLSFYEGSESFTLATGMFVENAINLNASYVETAKNYLQSSVEKLNFQTDPNAGRSHINDWFRSHTNGKIAELFPEGSINMDTRLVLGNAMYFHGTWTTKFPVNSSAELPFYQTLTDKVNVTTMRLVHNLRYYKDAGLHFSALALPYQGYSFQMIILLPDAKDGLAELESNLSKIQLHDLEKNMTFHNVDVTLPKFKIEQTSELKATLSKMGCPTMFSENADLTDIGPFKESQLYVSSVVHKANVDVTFEGTEAAAATGLIANTRSFHRKSIEFPKAVFLADHPFIFVITSGKTIMFMGRLKKF